MHATALGPAWLGVVPFTLLLACMAILPLWAPRFWEHNRNKALAAALTASPVVVWLLATNARALEHSALDYVSFVCLLGSLFVVSGGVHVEGDLKATPATNVALLGVGALLASLIGTFEKISCCAPILSDVARRICLSSSSSWCPTRAGCSRHWATPLCSSAT